MGPIHMRAISFSGNNDNQAQLEAISKSQAVIHFKPDGTILWANPNFLNTMGYSLDEIEGRHHRMFVDPDYANSSDYRNFWDRLQRGEFEAMEYKRFGKGGKEVWIQASYNPVKDKSGRVNKVVKFASDVTAQKLEGAKCKGQISAIDKSQAVIHFDLNGNILWANENFLNTLGYSLDEIVGKHHRMFVDPSYANSSEYSAFWQKLKRGEYDAAEYKRHGKGGKEIWIQASYNPIMDMNGNPFMVAKFATDITNSVKGRHEKERLSAQINEGLLTIADSVSQARVQAQTVASASTETSATVNAVASAAEELTSSIAEISSTTVQTRMAVDDAIKQTDVADNATQNLVKTTAQMTGIIELIQNIAGQINLLALNATIESARAGEAGKGFAVVASEVKQLANQVAEATTQISTEIEQLQSVSSEVVKGLEKIKHSVKSVEHSVATVAGAVEEQTAVTQEISANMQTASEATSMVDKGIHEILHSIDMADSASGEVKANIEQMSRL